jgi:hypothetical protein
LLDNGQYSLISPSSAFKGLQAKLQVQIVSLKLLNTEGFCVRREEASMISVKNDHDYIHYEDVREAFGTVSLTSTVLNKFKTIS